jgi:3-methyl-2-oxobutanoate hydroxymethyltransferase
MSVTAGQNIKRNTLRTLGAKKGVERVTMLTAYDVVMAKELDEAGIDILLVGDSLGNVVYGYDTTLPVTLDMMVAHTAAVARGSKRALVVADLPFLTYQISREEAIRNGGRCLAEGGAQAVKVEGASSSLCETVRGLVEAGIPVVGHIGLTPQSVHQQGGFFTHGKTLSEEERLVTEALALEKAGVFALVLECVTEAVADKITKAIKPLTIGIGSGKVCDGEVLVTQDLLGLSPGKSPSFVQPKADLRSVIRQVAESYAADVKKVGR